jgi:hypothetical protein
MNHNVLVLPFQITIKDGESGFTYETVTYTPRARLDMSSITRYVTYDVSASFLHVLYCPIYGLIIALYL